MKKLWSVILIFCFFITGCSTKNTSSTQEEITHAKFFDNYATIQINDKSYFLSSADSKTIKNFQGFYRDYSSKIAKQALTLNINKLFDNRESNFTYSFFIDGSLLDQKTKLKLEQLHQAKLYQNQYIMVSFMARAQPYYKKDLLEDKYKLEQPIPILITEQTEELSSGGEVFFLLTSPIWLPFMLLFGLKV